MASCRTTDDEPLLHQIAEDWYAELHVSQAGEYDERDEYPREYYSSCLTKRVAKGFERALKKAGFKALAYEDPPDSYVEPLPDAMPWFVSIELPVAPE